MLCIRVTLKTLHLISFNFRLTFLECSSMVLKSVFKRSGSVSELIVLKIIPKKVIAVSLQKSYDVSVDQTIVKMKKKNQIIVIVMMWGRPEFMNDRNLKRRFKGFWEDSAVRSSKNFAKGIPMPGIKPGPWRWKRQILIDEFHVDILRAFFDVCKTFFQWKCIIVRIDCSKDYVGETRIYQRLKSGT